MPLPLLIAGGLAAYNAISGIVKKAKAKKLAANNPRPVEMIPDEVKENTQIAKDLANQGIPAAQYSQAQQEIEKSSAAAIGSSVDRRGGLSAIGTIQANTDAAKNNLTAESAAARVSNIKNLMTRNDITSQWKDKLWDYNERTKYEENAAAIRALAGAGAEDVNTGLDLGASTLATALDQKGDGTASKLISSFRKKSNSKEFGSLGGIDPEALKALIAKINLS